MIWRRLKKATQQQRQEFRERMSHKQVSMGDRFAMMLAAYLTILLPCALILLAFGLLILWLFGAL